MKASAETRSPPSMQHPQELQPLRADGMDLRESPHEALLNVYLCMNACILDYDGSPVSWLRGLSRPLLMFHKLEKRNEKIKNKKRKWNELRNEKKKR